MAVSAGIPNYVNKPVYFDPSRFTFDGAVVNDQKFHVFGTGTERVEWRYPAPLDGPLAAAKIVYEDALEATIVDLEGPKIGIYCPRCGKGGLREKSYIGLRRGQKETCLGCMKQYVVPDILSTLTADGLRKLAADAVALAHELDEIATALERKRDIVDGAFSG